MCGIVGVISANAPEKAFECLKALEYRGYDSWGIAAPTNNGFYLQRQIGKIGQSVLNNAPQTEIAIGHTRWATHGKVLEKNAHPHISNDGKIAIVHNGIVENFVQLKKDLLSKGFHFNSETDSEVIANLIQKKISEGNSFENALRLCALELEGNYAIAALHYGEKKIVCAKNGSPLVVGFCKDGFVVASDASAFINSTRQVLFVPDAKMVVIDSDVKLIDIANGVGEKYKTKTLEWGFEQAKKGDFAHFMIKEISEQPSTLLAAAKQPVERIEKVVSLIKSSKKIFFVGCGSSYHASLAGVHFLSSVAKIDSRASLASEFDQLVDAISSDSLVIALSQSGETADLLDAIKLARERGAKIVGIVNAMDSSVMRASDLTLLMNAGPEICVLSTKSYTSQLAILLLIAYSAANKLDLGKEIISKTSFGIQKIIEDHSKIKKVAKELSKKPNMFVIGRSQAYPAALECALKIKEVSYIHAEGFAGGELKHGTIALIEEGTPAIVLCTPLTRKLILSNAIEMKSRGAKIIGVDSQNSDVFDIFFQIPECNGAEPLHLVIPCQLLAYYIALEKNLDPDKPRNLAKSVTVK